MRDNNVQLAKQSNDPLIELAENIAALLDLAQVRGASQDEVLGVLAVLIYAGTDTPEGRIVLDMEHTQDKMVLQIRPEVEVEGCECGC